MHDMVASESLCDVEAREKVCDNTHTHAAAVPHQAVCEGNGLTKCFADKGCCGGQFQRIGGAVALRICQTEGERRFVAGDLGRIYGLCELGTLGRPDLTPALPLRPPRGVVLFLRQGRMPKSCLRGRRGGRPRIVR